MISKEQVIEAFRKLQSQIYYDKSNLILRKRLAEFTLQLQKNEDVVLNEIVEVANNIQDNNLQKWLDDIKINIYPKKFSPLKESDKNIITNFSNRICNIERINFFADVPIQLRILDVLWIIEYGAGIDSGLISNSLGNRLFLNSEKEIV